MPNDLTTKFKIEQFFSFTLVDLILASSTLLLALVAVINAVKAFCFPTIRHTRDQDQQQEEAEEMMILHNQNKIVPHIEVTVGPDRPLRSRERQRSRPAGQVRFVEGTATHVGCSRVPGPHHYNPGSQHTDTLSIESRESDPENYYDSEYD